VTLAATISVVTDIFVSLATVVAVVANLALPLSLALLWLKAIASTFAIAFFSPLYLGVLRAPALALALEKTLTLARYTVAPCVSRKLMI
jgi:hypothetical protein